MRRIIHELPTSQMAVWSRRLGVFGLTLGLICVALARTSSLDAASILAVLGGAIVSSCVAVALAAVATVEIWQTGRRGSGAVLGGLFFATLLLAWPTYLTLQAIRLPEINDVSTDLNDPPVFSTSAQANAARANTHHPDMPPADRDAQRRAYPDVQPIVLDMDPEGAWDMVQQTVTALGWKIADQQAPAGPKGLGRLDAIVKSPVLGLPEDVAVRLRPIGNQTRIDIRSAGRAGRHDFGSNANRIRRFAAELQNQLDDR